MIFLPSTYEAIGAMMYHAFHAGSYQWIWIPRGWAKERVKEGWSEAHEIHMGRR